MRCFFLALVLPMTLAIPATKSWQNETSPQAQQDGQSDKKTVIARVGQPGVTPPTILEKGIFNYPVKGKDEQVADYVIVEAVFKKNGTVSAIKVLRGLGKGMPGFETSIRDHLKTWKFEPGKVAGVPADVRVILRVRIELH